MDYVSDCQQNNNNSNNRNSNRIDDILNRTNHLDHIYINSSSASNRIVYQEFEMQHKQDGGGDDGDDDVLLKQQQQQQQQQDSIDNIEFDQDEQYCNYKQGSIVDNDQINSSFNPFDNNNNNNNNNNDQDDDIGQQKEIEGKEDDNDDDDDDEIDQVKEDDEINNSSNSRNSIYHYQQQQQQYYRHPFSYSSLLMNVGLFMLFIAIFIVNDSLKENYIMKKDSNANQYQHRQQQQQQQQQQQHQYSAYYQSLLKRETDLKDLLDKYEKSNKLGDLDQSLSVLNSVIRLSPRYCAAIFRIAQILNMKTQFENAENMYIRALECERWLKLEYIIELVLFYNSNERYQESYALSSRAILFFPNDYHLNKILNSTKDIILNRQYGDVNLDYQGRLLPYFSAIE